MLYLTNSIGPGSLEMQVSELVQRFRHFGHNRIHVSDISLTETCQGREDCSHQNTGLISQGKHWGCRHCIVGAYNIPEKQNCSLNNNNNNNNNNNKQRNE